VTRQRRRRGFHGGGELGFAAALELGVGARVEEIQGRRAAYKGLGNRLWRAATQRLRTRGELGAGDAVRVDPVARKGMTGGPRSSASVAGRAERRWPWAGLGRKTKQAGALGGCGGLHGCWRGQACAAVGLGRAGWAAGPSGGLLRCRAAARLVRAARLAAGLGLRRPVGWMGERGRG
jgi:hypothetical protein